MPTRPGIFDFYNNICQNRAIAAALGVCDGTVARARAWAQIPPSTARPPGSKPHTISKADEPQAGDEAVGVWSREKLAQMDAEFREAVEHAIRAGLERRPDDERPVRAA